MSGKKIKRITLIGPESSGKTTLSKQLAAHYKTLWVPEFAREFIEKLNRPYNSEDILFTAKEQLKAEEGLLSQSSKILFIDTDLIIAKIWCEDVFGFCHEWISEKIEEKKYDLYLLTKPDLPWEQDTVRENPNRRDYFFELYVKELQKRKFKYEIVAGSGQDRFRNAVEAVERFLKTTN